MRDSCRAAGITEGIANFHGMLLYEAQRKGRNMSWERWQQIQNGDNTIVDAVFEDILENIVDNLRDEILDAMLGDIVSNLLGAPLEYVSAIRMIYDENQWNNRNNDERDRYRTHSVYLWLMAVVATNQSRRTGQNPGEILALLSHQALLYQVWWQQHYPAVERWIAESGLGTRRMSTAPRYLRIPR
jgi:hypothetical protein